ncbi:RDD family protein [Nocardia camponoti]|uniref:Transporter n=1 Tax=Nocardia camponoti TaxID=1616106 RepID=A0A917QKG1_9NOCA|nr:RDD family protein [Nocardia camponoti]GGK54956.1 transporter [Nocardia camponoti]
MAEFTTGEAVSLELPIARVPCRAGAFLLDLMMQIALALLLVFLFFGLIRVGSMSDDAWEQTVGLLIVVTVLVGYPVVSETLSRGRSLGKLVFGLRVVRTDAGPIDFRHAITRGLCGALVDFWMLGFFGAVAVVSSTCSPQGRRIGDLLAGTVVIHTRASLPIPALVSAPPWLVNWAKMVDLTGITDEHAAAMRKYLARMRTLTPAAQHHLGTTLVESVCAAGRAPIPAGYPPFHVLGAVLARRQEVAFAAR